METNKTKYAMQYGLYLGIYIGLRFFFGMTQNLIFSLISFVMWIGIPVIVYYIIKNYRDNLNGGFISLGKAWGLGWSLYFFSGMIVELIQFIYFRFINQDILAKSTEAVKEMYERFNMQIDNLDTIEKIMQPHFYVLSDFLVSFILGGSIISLIIASIVQRKPNPFQS